MAKGHYIPQTYLRRFLDKSLDSEQTWQIVKTKNCKIISVPISNICQKSNLYISKAFDNKDDNEFIEKVVYSKNIEPDYNDAYKLLVNPQKNTLTHDERELIMISILSMYYRHFDNLSKKDIIDESDIKAISEFLLAKGKKTEYGNENLNLDFKNPSEIIRKVKDANKENFIIDHLRKSLELIKQRLNDSICVVRLKDEFSLISSDRPFYFNNYFGFLSFCLPIDKNHLVLISPIDNDGSITRLDYVDDDLNTVIELINNEIEFRLSKSIVISENEKVLQDYLNKRKEFGLDSVENDNIDFKSIMIDKKNFGYE